MARIVLSAAVLAGTFVGVAATSASAGSWRWVGTSTLSQCNIARDNLIDQNLRVTSCTRDQNGYHFYWYYYD